MVRNRMLHLMIGAMIFLGLPGQDAGADPPVSAAISSLLGQREEVTYRRLVEVAPFFSYRIRFSDIPLFSEEMKLDKVQQEILEQIVMDYQMALDVEYERIYAVFLKIQEAKKEDNPNWERQKQERRKLLRSLEHLGREERESRIRSSLMGEINASEGRDPLISARSSEIHRWQSLRDEQWAMLKASVDAIRNPDQPGHWDAVERAMRRRNSPWRPELYGESVDLGQILYRYWGKNHPATQAASVPLMEYTIAYDDALRNRDRVIDQTQLIVLDSSAYQDPGPWLRSSQKQVAARAALANVNEQFVDPIAMQMPPEDALLFKKRALKAIYPDLYRTSRFENAVDYIRNHQQERLDFSPELRTGIDELEVEYWDQLKALNQARLEVVREADQRRLLARMEEDISMKCYNLMSPMNEEAYKIIELRDELDDQFHELDASFLQQLQVLIGPAEWDKLPLYAHRLGRGDQSRTPVPDADPNAPVIYLDGPGDKGGVVFTPDERLESSRGVGAP